MARDARFPALLRADAMTGLPGALNAMRRASISSDLSQARQATHTTTDKPDMVRPIVHPWSTDKPDIVRALDAPIDRRACPRLGRKPLGFPPIDERKAARHPLEPAFITSNRTDFPRSSLNRR